MAPGGVKTHPAKNLGLQIHHLRLQVFVQAMFTISPANPGLTPASVEALHRLEVLAVDVGLAEAQFARRLHRGERPEERPAQAGGCHGP